MEHIANPTNEDLQSAVETALRAAIGPDAPHIGVAADHGSVTLTGEMRTDSERRDAHAAVLGVGGVHAVADDVIVRDGRVAGETDSEIARAAQVALQQATEIPIDSVIAEVRHHVLTLTGRVRSNGERLAAERAVIYVPGLTRINNRITVKS